MLFSSSGGTCLDVNAQYRCNNIEKLIYDRAPTAGGQYHWCAMLAPMNCMKFLSYVTGEYFFRSHQETTF